MQKLKKLKKSKRGRQRFKVWFKQARYDLEAAKSSLAHGFVEWAAYQAEQAVEKSLKAILVHAGWRPPRIHKLQVLIGMANRANEEFRQTKFNFRYLESFTFISRYPFLIPGRDETPHELITHDDSNNAIEQAEEFLDKVGMILDHEPSVPKNHMHTDEEIYSKENLEKRIADVKNILIREFDPQKIILFGRLAREASVHKPSTLDLLIVAQTDEPFIKRIIKARSVTKGSLPVVEPLIYTPQEFKLMTEEEGDSFFEEALAEGKVLFEKTPSS